MNHVKFQEFLSCFMAMNENLCMLSNNQIYLQSKYWFNIEVVLPFDKYLLSLETKKSQELVGTSQSLKEK